MNMQIVIGNNSTYFYNNFFFRERYSVDRVFPFHVVFYFYLPIFSFFIFIHYCLLLNIMNKPVLYCILLVIYQCRWLVLVFWRTMTERPSSFLADKRDFKIRDATAVRRDWK